MYQRSKQLFIALTICGIIWVYFCVPETKGIALEELAEIFGDEIAVHARDIHVDNNQVQLQTHGEGSKSSQTKEDEKGPMHQEEVDLV
jgi:hypothetical protein